MRRPEFRPSPELYPFTSRWFQSSVGPIHYIDEGAGSPILFLHGNPTWSFLYRAIVRDLRDRFRCIAVDLPGFGLSERPQRYGYTPAEHAAVVQEFVNHLGLRDCIIMGHDWGGPIGVWVATRAPDRVRGLVLGNTWFWRNDRWATWAFSRVMSSRPMQRRILERNYFVDDLLPRGMAGQLSQEEMDHYRWAQPSPGMRVGVAEFPRQILAAGDWLEGLERAARHELPTKPALLVWGMRDFAIPPRFIPRVRAAFPDSEVVELRGAKHYIQEDAPQEIVGAIAARFR